MAIGEIGKCRVEIHEKYDDKLPIQTNTWWMLIIAHEMLGRVFKIENETYLKSARL
jgi:hypothetical protein